MAKLKELINIVGKENYAEDEADLISYSRDAFPGEWHMPEVVVRPETTEQVSRNSIDAKRCRYKPCSKFSSSERGNI